MMKARSKQKWKVKYEIGRIKVRSGGIDRNSSGSQVPQLPVW